MRTETDIRKEYKNWLHRVDDEELLTELRSMDDKTIEEKETIILELADNLSRYTDIRYSISKQKCLHCSDAMNFEFAAMLDMVQGSPPFFPEFLEWFFHLDPQAIHSHITFLHSAPLFYDPYQDPAQSHLY